MNIEKLRNYYAKDDSTTIYEHNDHLHNVLKQLTVIYNLNNILLNSLRTDILYHDIGKVADEFQQKITATNRNIRHEILSACPAELTQNQRIAILLHHKSFVEIQKRINNENFDLYFQDYSQDLKTKLDINEVIDIKNFVNWFFDFRNKKESVLSDKSLILERGFLQYCDHLASAGVKTINTGYDAEKVYCFDNLTSVQKKVKTNTQDNIMIIARTGCGKTEASLFYANSVQDDTKSRRIYYILPFTASVNSMYKRLNKNKDIASMLHGKALYFLYKETNDENIAKVKYNMFKKSINQITVTTIFQVVKAFFNFKYSDMLIAQMSNSIFIIDELHCFDTKLLVLIVETLKFMQDYFHASICIMSASIHKGIRDIVAGRLGIDTIFRLSDEENSVKRHKLYLMGKEFDTSALDGILSNYINSDKRILVCVNNVAKSQEVYQYLIQKGVAQKEIALLHGRFNTIDREKIEERIMCKDIRILIGTQAIEVSLDIDFDVLHTEICPFDSLLQRCGRVNRNRGIDNNYIANIFVYDIDNKSYNIYDNKYIIGTKKVICDIIAATDGIIDECKVEQYLDIVYFDFNKADYNKYQKMFERIIQSYKVGFSESNNMVEILFENSDAVLPKCLVGEYDKYIQDNKYFEANALFVSISNKQISRLIKEGSLESYQKDQFIKVLNKEYRSNIGLLL